MTFEIAPGILIAFLLALARSSAWLVVAPPFNTRTVPTVVKVGFAASLAVAVAPRLASSRSLPTDTASLVTAIVVQVAAGVTLGFLALLLFSAVQSAGSLIDLFGGFTVAAAYDPLANAQSSVFGRFYQLLATVLLFATNGHLLLVRGFMASFDAVTPGGSIAGGLSDLLIHDLGVLFVAAVEIAAPLLAALFLAEIALGLLSKAAPQMNVFMVGFPVKILLTLSLVGFALPLLPGAMSNLLGQLGRAWVDAGRAIGGLAG